MKEVRYRKAVREKNSNNKAARAAEHRNGKESGLVGQHHSGRGCERWKTSPPFQNSGHGGVTTTSLARASSCGGAIVKSSSSRIFSIFSSALEDPEARP